jgi:hypothetical protein
MSRMPLRVGSPVPRCANGAEQPQLGHGRLVEPPDQRKEA